MPRAGELMSVGAAALVGGASLRQDSELSGPLQEIVALMEASGAILAIQGNDPQPLQLLHVSMPPSVATEEVLGAIRHMVDNPNFEERQCQWQRLRAETRQMLFMMPVKRIAGHDRLVIGVIFDNPAETTVQNAEALFRQRKPFAIGFFQLWQQKRVLERRLHIFKAALDQTSIGTLLLDRTARVLFANQAAHDILAAADGLALSGGVIRAVRLSDAANLHAALSHATASGSGRAPAEARRVPLIAFHRNFGAPLVAAILPGGDGTAEGDHTAAVMYVVDPVLDVTTTIAPLCRLHGLSQVETSLVCRLASGDTITAAAEAIHVKEQTARSYLKAVFIKTGTRRQTELIALLLSSLLRIKRGAHQEALAPA